MAPTGEADSATTGIGAMGRVEPRGSSAPTVETGRVGPSGSGPLARGIVLAPVGAAGGADLPGAEGAEGGDAARGGAGAEGGGGAVGGPDLGAGGGDAGEFGEVGAEATPMGEVVGPLDGSGEVASIGSVAAEGIGPVAGTPAIEVVDGPPEGIGVVDPFGATGPDSSACALKLMRTVSFFKGTVEVLTEGLGGS